MERLDWVGPAHSSGGGGSHQGYPAYEGIGDCNTLVSVNKNLSHQLCTPYYMVFMEAGLSGASP
jgi:hypothetical protein